jgi:hypothetical protein
MFNFPNGPPRFTSVLGRLASFALFSCAFPLSGATFAVTSTSDSGAGSFRQALIDANSNEGLDTITFSIGGSGVKTISPVSALPPVIDPVVIDGTTQPGFTSDPLIELKGSNAGQTPGLRLLAGNSVVKSLIINQFGADGILIQGTGSNRVTGCWIGTHAAGRDARPNRQEGVFINSSSFNTIGGSLPTDRNVISGNGDAGVYILLGSGNLILGNFIGTAVGGTAALGNENSGVIVYNAPSNNIGGVLRSDGNLISGNKASGVYLFGAASIGNVFQNNLIGTDTTGRAALGNRGDGVTLANAVLNLVGGSDLTRNIISGNLQAGVFLTGQGSTSNSIAGNFIGTDVDGLAALGNNLSGVVLQGAAGNRVGTRTPAGGNVISGNKQDGVFISTNSTGNVLEGNMIGLNAFGTQRLANTLNGISIRSSDANEVGGIIAGCRNVISGNGYYGLQIAEGSRSNIVAGNFIGTTALGDLAISNTLSGIRVESPGNAIGGSSAGAGNVICANGLDGISLVGSLANANLVYGNSIGLNALGSPLGNGRAGIGVSAAPKNEIGGAEPGQGNVISANGDAGVYIVGSGASGNRMRGNRIGTDLLGSLPYQNFYEGVFLQASSSNLIGGSLAGEGNVISGNRTRGLFLTNSSWNVIQGNSVGVSATGDSALANGFHGVELEEGALENVIGGEQSSAGNRIGFTRDIYAGVRVREGSLRNAILSNLIFDTGGLGIDLGEYGVAPNDTCDTDTGANMLQNFPVVSRADMAGGQVSIRGELNSTQGQRFTIQFFGTDVPGLSGQGLARYFLGETNITVGTGCLANFSAILPLANVLPKYVSATATDESGNTSEFSAAIPATALSLAFTLSLGGDWSLRWPNEPAGVVLLETDSLTAPLEWQVAADQGSIIGNLRVVTLRPGATKFFRLGFQ